MGKKVLLIPLAGVLALALIAGTGCRRVPLDRDDFGDRISANDTTSSVALQGATRLDARIDFGVGELRMDSAEESGAVSTRFDYNHRSWRPEVDYSVSGGTGRLSISQPHINGPSWPMRNTRNTWELGLPTGVPTALEVNLGVGESDLVLGKVALERLDVKMGVGDATIDLTGASKSLNADVEAGVGQLVLRVPRNVGVRVTGRHDGLGDYHADGMKSDGDAYVNDAYGKSPVTLDIALRRGVGDVTIELVD